MFASARQAADVFDPTDGPLGLILAVRSVLRKCVFGIFFRGYPRVYCIPYSSLKRMITIVIHLVWFGPFGYVSVLILSIPEHGPIMYLPPSFTQSS